MDTLRHQNDRTCFRDVEAAIRPRGKQDPPARGKINEFSCETFRDLHSRDWEARLPTEGT